MATSREKVEQLLHASLHADADGFVRLMAPDGCIEWPFRPPGAPARVRGRAEIHRFLTGTASAVVRFAEYRDVVLHETTDPDVVVVEYAAHGTAVATGAPFRQTVVAVIRFEDGLITTYRDYLDPLPLMALLNRSSGPEPAPA
jgi:ketosteroid isomerase-like protein